MCVCRETEERLIAHEKGRIYRDWLVERLSSSKKKKQVP